MRSVCAAALALRMAMPLSRLQRGVRTCGARLARGWAAAPLAALLGALAVPATAAETQFWVGATLTAGLARDGAVRLWLDGQVRTRAGSDEVDVTVIHPGLGVRVARGTDLWAGYARVTTHRPGPDVLEDRLWQQATYALGSPGRLALSGRTRLEQRLRTNAGQTGWRLRQSLRASLPTGIGSLALVASNELFVGLNDTRWGQPAGLDQNRGFVGLAVTPLRPMRLEAGYLAQRVERASGRDLRRGNVVMTSTLTF